MGKAGKWAAGTCAAALVGAGVGSAAPAQAAAYDLVVTDVRPVVPGVQATGSEVAFQATIKNQGTAPTPGGTVHGVAFAVGGQTVTWNDVDSRSLAPGASRTLTATWGGAGKSTWTAGEGRFTLRAWVDDVDRIRGEANEGNNTRTTTISATPVKPVTDLTVRPAIDQATFEQTHAKTVKASWTVPAGQPAGVKYTVVEHSTRDYATCSAPTATKGTTTATSMTFDIEAGLDCYSHASDNEVDYTVVATAASGRPAVTSAYSAKCRAFHNYEAYGHGRETWDLGCESASALHDFVDPVWAVIDAGSPVPQGAWEKDHGFTGGQPHTASFPGLTPEQTTSRWGWTRYDAPVDPSFTGGQWKVRLTFVEPTFTRAGQRVFDVKVNGQVVAKDLDIFAKVGRGKPYVIETTIPQPGKTVQIVPTKKVDNPIVAGIEVMVF
ncbi:malectin domain-containing carbohydrate-binding protein [Kineococcus arenarius]|uniref:malectin domain-containing carbohydrate-binding protein n=1 Tax=Kineococcus sp. SYSU DK007 TaxID=3383128 RepID=UPI003D7D0745